MRKMPKGVMIFGALLVITSLIQMRTFIVYSRLGYYDFLFQPLPESVIFIRGFCTAILRIAGFASGVGILCGREIFRKTALAVAVVTVLTFYLKHPYYAVRKHAEVTAQLVAMKTGAFKVTEASMVDFIAKSSVFALWAIDVGFAVAVIYYFTRPQVRQWFKERG